MINNPNIQTFFALLSAGLWGNGNPNIRIDGTTDWQKVYQLAQEQSVVGLVAAGIERLKNANVNVDLNHKLLFQIIGEVQMTEQRNKAMNLFVADIIEKLREHDIYALLIKGQGIAQCYERPLWRTSGDVDLLLSEDNYEKAKKFLKPIASSVDNEGVDRKHLGMTIDSWVVELHGTLYCGMSESINRMLNELQKDLFYRGNVRSWINGNTDVFLPGADVDAIYIFTHFLKHFYKGGIGLRQICDWCRLLWTYRDSLNHELLKSRIRKMGLITQWKAFGAFAVEYLGMPADAMPLYDVRSKRDEVRWKKKADRIMEFVMEVGNFGHNRDNSYYAKYPFIIRKFYSLGRRCGDLIRHARIFPLDSLKFFPSIFFNGIRSAARGEG